MKNVLLTAALLAGVCGGVVQNRAVGQVAQGQLVSAGLTLPIWITYAPGDAASRLFVIEKQGRIRIIQNNVVNATPFLDVDAITTGGTSVSNEQGLLGLVFHPNYQTNGLFYIYHITGTSPGFDTLAEYRVLGDPATSNVADPATRRVLFSIADPFTNHNGGWLAFGPDGFLYVGIGDGGDANDPGNRAQNTSVLLGKMLRIDVNGTDPGLQYRIPPSNPFAGAGVAGADEIWAYGLRNPWRSSFDRLTGDLYIGDVGQGAWEEVDYQPVTSVGGENYGWRCMEGNHSTGLSGCTPFAPNLKIPIHEYVHSGAGECSITGGYVYRGSLIPQLYGKYVFGDYCTGQIWTIPAGQQGIAPATPLFDMGDNLTSFGEDANGELYYTDQNSSQLWRLVAVRCSAADLTNGAIPGGPGYGQPNGILNSDDFFYYLAQYAAGNLAVADLTTSAVPGSPGYGVPNGFINNDDFFYYLNLYAIGCPP